MSGGRVRLAAAGDLPSLAEIERRACVRFEPLGLGVLARLLTPPADTLSTLRSIPRGLPMDDRVYVIREINIA